MADGDDPVEQALVALPPYFLHELNPKDFGFSEGTPSLREQQQPSPQRLLPGRAFPPYAYLPGRKLPHPVRDPSGHSYGGTPVGAQADPEAFRWGLDLFNYGYYWEAHEAWEVLWREAAKEKADRELLHGLILLAAAGVKLRERKSDAARRHGMRAASFFRQIPSAPKEGLLALLRLSPTDLASRAESAVLSPVPSLDRRIVFNFALGDLPLAYEAMWGTADEETDRRSISGECPTGTGSST